MVFDAIFAHKRQLAWIDEKVNIKLEEQQLKSRNEKLATAVAQLDKEYKQDLEKINAVITQMNQAQHESLENRRFAHQKILKPLTYSQPAYS